jgi:hypothetical protein
MHEVFASIVAPYVKLPTKVPTVTSLAGDSLIKDRCSAIVKVALFERQRFALRCYACQQAPFCATFRVTAREKRL